MSWACRWGGISLGSWCYLPTLSVGTSSGWHVKIFSLEFFFSREGTYSFLLGEMVSDVSAWLLPCWRWTRERGLGSQCSVILLIMACPHLTSHPLPVSPEHSWFPVYGEPLFPNGVGMVVVWGFGFYKLSLNSPDFNLVVPTSWAFRVI